MAEQAMPLIWHLNIILCSTTTSDMTVSSLQPLHQSHDINQSV